MYDSGDRHCRFPVIVSSKKAQAFLFQYVSSVAACLKKAGNFRIELKMVKA